MLLPLLHHLGPRWLAQRTRFALERKLGLLAKRSPQRPWANFGPTKTHPAWRVQSPSLPITKLDRTFLAPHLEAWALAGGHSPVAEAEAMARGQFRIFSHTLCDLGYPPQWAKNVLTGRTISSSAHWTKSSDAGADDIKGVWEASRFSWAFTLVRAWALDGEARHVELFWKLVEDWMEKNPPNRGPNWMCGQEAALRLIAFTYALQVFRHHPATTDERILLGARFADATAHRILVHFDYALSQSNNHGISEAIGLLTAGTFWPELSAAASWRQQGLQALEAQVANLVADDGGFSQHSTNYHRLFLQLMTWGELVQRAVGTTLPAATRQRVRQATRFLFSLMESDGTVPRYGADDGVNLFQLSGCGYDDFRPALGAAMALFLGERLPAGPWDEAAIFLLGPLPASAASELTCTYDHPRSGVSTLHHARGTAFFRAPTIFRHRPAQADQLHVTLRWDDEWITEDPGTYSYNAPGVMNGLAGARYHNVATVNGLDPMKRAGRFLWLPWTACQRLPEAWGYRATHSGSPGFIAERRLLKFPQGFVIIDRLRGMLRQPGEWTLRWHGRSRAGLEKLSIACSVASAESWLTADETTGEGWYSGYYGAKTPSYTRRLTAMGDDVIFVTALGCEIRLEKDAVIVDGESIAINELS